MQRSEHNGHKWVQACLWFDDPDPPPPPTFSWLWLSKKRHDVALILHSLPMQLMITSLIILDLVLSIDALFADADKDDKGLKKSLGVVVIAFLAVEISVRVFVEGLTFFRSPLNDIEALIVYGGLILIFIGPNVPVGIGRILKPITRMLRAFRVAMKVWLRGSHLKRSAGQAIAEKVKETITNVTEGLVRIRPENMGLDLQAGTFNIRKARLYAEALEGAHLPISVQGGFVDDLHLHVPMPSNLGVPKIRLPCLRRKKPKADLTDSSLIILEVSNALLVLGPAADVDWQDEEMIKTRKSKLVDLIDTFVPKRLPVVAASESATSNSRDVVPREGAPTIATILMRKVEIVGKALKRVALDMIRTKFIRGVKIRVSNIAVQYENYLSETLAGSAKPLKYNIGFRLGVFSVTTAMHASALSKLLTDAEHGSMLVSNTNLNPEGGQDENKVRKSRHETFVFGKNAQVQDENVSIRLERVSSYCDMQPTIHVCYTPSLKKLEMQTALRKLIVADRLQRIRQALSRSSTIASRRGKRRTPCDCRGEALPLMLQQQTYVLLPMTVRLNWSIPGLLGTDCIVVEDDDEDPRAFRILSSPISIVLDNFQLDAFNRLFLRLQTFFKQDRQLHLRPEIRICKVLPANGVKEDWHARALRKQVVRQWWLHAFLLTPELSRASTRALCAFSEMQIRANRRAEFLELVAHHKFRVREHYRSGRLSRFVFGIFGRTSPQESIEVKSVYDRLKLLQMRMRYIDILLATMEARYLAAQREADTRARSSKRAALADSVKEAVKQVHETEETTTHDKQVEDQIAQEVIEQLGALGLRIDAFLPEYVAVRCPVMEVCMYTVSEWMVKPGGIKPPRYHLNGTRQKLFHAWMQHGGFVFFLGYIEQDHLPLPSIQLEAITVFSKTVGATYCNLRTGKEREAVWFDPIPGDDSRHFMVAHFTRDPGTDLQALSRLGPKMLSEARSSWSKKNGGDKPPWNGVIHIGCLSVSLDMMQLRRMQGMFGYLGTFAFERVVRLVLAEPHWRAFIPELKFYESDRSPARQHHQIEEADLNRYLHRLARLTELTTCIALPINSDIHVEVKLWGYHCCILQPDWTENQWRGWLQAEAAPHGGFPGRRPQAPPVHMLKCEVNVPRLRSVFHRKQNPVQVSFELLQCGEEALAEVLNDALPQGPKAVPSSSESSSPSHLRSRAGSADSVASASWDSVLAEDQLLRPEDSALSPPSQSCGLFKNSTLKIAKVPEDFGDPLGIASLKSIVVVPNDTRADRSLNRREIEL